MFKSPKTKLAVIIVVILAFWFPIPGAYVVKYNAYGSTSYLYGAKVLNSAECQFLANWYERKMFGMGYSTSDPKCVNTLVDLIRYRFEW